MKLAHRVRNANGCRVAPLGNPQDQQLHRTLIVKRMHLHRGFVKQFAGAHCFGWLLFKHQLPKSVAIKLVGVALRVCAVTFGIKKCQTVIPAMKTMESVTCFIAVLLVKITRSRSWALSRWLRSFRHRWPIPSMQPFAWFAFLLDFKVRKVERANGLDRPCKCVVRRSASFCSPKFSSHRAQGAKHMRTIKPLPFAVIAKRHRALTGDSTRVPERHDCPIQLVLWRSL
jgi:hypothetical protein